MIPQELESQDGKEAEMIRGKDVLFDWQGAQELDGLRAPEIVGGAQQDAVESHLFLVPLGAVSQAHGVDVGILCVAAVVGVQGRPEVKVVLFRVPIGESRGVFWPGGAEVHVTEEQGVGDERGGQDGEYSVELSKAVFGRFLVGFQVHRPHTHKRPVQVDVDV